MYKVEENTELPLGKNYLKEHVSIGRSDSYINLRDVVVRFKFPPGRYVVIPSTYEPNKEGKFVLRIFAEKKTATTVEEL